MLALFSPGTPRTMTLKLAVGLAAAFARRVEGTKAPLFFAASAEPAPKTRRSAHAARSRRPPRPQRALPRVVLLFDVRCWGCRMCPVSLVVRIPQSCVGPSSGRSGQMYFPLSGYGPKDRSKELARG